MRVSTKLTGEGDSVAVPFPRPHLLLADTRKAQQKRQGVPKEIVSLEGFRPKNWEQFGNNNAQIPGKTDHHETREGKTNQQDSKIFKVSGTKGRAFESPQARHSPRRRCLQSLIR